MKFKRLIPALAMLLVSAILLGTSTFAWFSMNTTVTATAMQVKAVAEDGILIANVDKADWSNSANAKVTTAQLVPTNAATIASPVFVHAKSTRADQVQAQQDVANYETLTLAWSDAGTSSGVGYVDADSDSAKDDDEKAYVLLNKFYIKSSGAVINPTSLLINDVVATGADKAIENSLRVLVVVTDGTTTLAKTYAPVIDIASGTTTLSYKWKNTDTVTALDATAAASKNLATGITSIPAYDTTTPIEAKVYIYFEGEDANCFSNNIAGITTNNIAVTVRFGTVAL